MEQEPKTGTIEYAKQWQNVQKWIELQSMIKNNGIKIKINKLEYKPLIEKNSWIIVQPLKSTIMTVRTQHTLEEKLKDFTILTKVNQIKREKNNIETQEIIPCIELHFIGNGQYLDWNKTKTIFNKHNYNYRYKHNHDHNHDHNRPQLQNITDAPIKIQLPKIGLYNQLLLFEIELKSILFSQELNGYLFTYEERRTKPLVSNTITLLRTAMKENQLQNILWNNIEEEQLT